MHVQDLKENRTRILKDQSEIDNRIANVASKQMRGRILALLPKSLVASAIEKCKATIAGTSKEPVSIRVRKMADSFKSTYGVSTDLIEKYLGNKIEETTLDQLINLIGVFNALKDGAKVSEYFVSDKGLSQDSISLDKAVSKALKEKVSVNTTPALDNALKTKDISGILPDIKPVEKVSVVESVESKQPEPQQSNTPNDDDFIF
jgi:hypothetical protein